MAFLNRDPNLPRETSRNPRKIVTSDPLAIIYNEGLWRLNNVSPMYKLQYQPVELKMYASKLKQAIVRSVQDTSAKYSVKLQELPNLRYSDEDASGLKVEVKSKNTIEFTALFLSWGQSEMVDESVHLPYMLERGEQKIGTAVKSTWQMLFDCNIKPYSLTQQQLLQFGFSFVDSDVSRKNGPFTITYKTPNVDRKEKTSLTFDVEDVSIMWDGMKDHAEDLLEQTNLTYHILQNQVFHMSGLDISALDVCEIRVPKAEIKSSGAVKMKTPDIVNCVFTILNQIKC